MKYDISIQLHSFNGAPFVQNITAVDGTISQTVMFFKDMLENALVNADPQEFNTAEKKLEIYRLLQKIHSADSEVNLSAEEVATIKKVVAKNMTITALGAIYDALENPKSTPPKMVVDDGEERTSK